MSLPPTIGYAGLHCFTLVLGHDVKGNLGYALHPKAPRLLDHNPLPLAHQDLGTQQAEALSVGKRTSTTRFDRETRSIEKRFP